MTTKITAFLNSKGGTGKSATAVNLACALQRAEQKVLLIDADAQYNASLHLGYNSTRIEEENIKTYADDLSNIRDSLLEGKPYKNDYSSIIETDEGVDFIPGSGRVTDIQEDLIRATTRETETDVLTEYLKSFRGRYDFVLIDLHPELGMMSRSVLKSSDLIIIPTTPDYLATEGMTQILDCITSVNHRVTPGILYTRVEAGNKDTEHFKKEIETNYSFKTNTFETEIPKEAMVGRAPAFGASVIMYAPSSEGAKAYLALAEEILGYKFSHTPKFELAIDEIDEISQYKKKAGKSLTESIAEKGILDRLVVRGKKNGRYELIHGYKRLSAARELNLETVPCEYIRILQKDIDGYRKNANKKEKKS